MKRLLCLLCCLSLLISCHPATLPPPEGKRTAVLFSSLAEIWLEAGGSVEITVGETVERGIVSKGVPLVDDGAGKTVNTELLFSLKPDLVIASADIPAQRAAAEALQKAGIPTLLWRVESFDDYLSALEEACRLTGNTKALAKAKQKKTAVDRRIDSACEQNTATMLFVRAGSTDASTKAKRAEDHFACAMLEELGWENVADKAPLLMDGLSSEAVLREDPDYLFFSLMGNEAAARAHVEEMLSRQPWCSLRAVKEGRAYLLPKELFHYKPNARWQEAYEYLAGLLREENGR